MADTAGLPPEGWYPDRPNATRLRHWTGAVWTNEFRPIGPIPVVPAVAPTAPAPLLVAAEPEPAPTAGESIPSRVREQGWQETFASKADAPRATSHTLAGWLYASSPLWLGALVIAGTTVLSIINPFLVQGGLGLIGFVATLLLARQDVRRLTQRGYRAPSLWWVILPFFYFVVRMVRVGTRGAAMVVVYLLSCVALVALLYLTFVSNPMLLNALVPSGPADSSAIPAPVATLTDQQRANLVTDVGVEAQLRIELAATFDVGSVDCAPFANLDAGTTTTCVVNLDGLDYNAGLQLTPDDPSTAFVLTGMIPVAG